MQANPPTGMCVRTPFYIYEHKSSIEYVELALLHKNDRGAVLYGDRLGGGAPGILSGLAIKRSCV